jgi:hypothetical protein
MAQIPRPPKQGNVMTYVAKVAAGYPRILAGEVDADLDTIYGAWNGGADTVNIRDGAITSAKLAADSVGPRELQDSAVQTAHIADGAVKTPDIDDGAVTDPKIVSVSWSKIGGTPASFPAGGTAGGDLTGSYPNPTIANGVVTAAKLAPGTLTGSTIAGDTITAREIAPGAVGTSELVDAAVTRPKLAPGALWDINSVKSVTVTAFNTATGNTWIPVATLPALTTRGASIVQLYTNHGLGAVFSGGPGNLLVRWVRNGAHLCNTVVGCNGSSGTLPVPSLPWLDIVPSAGAYTYGLEVFLGTGVAAVFFPGGVTGCALMAVEVG